MIQTINQYNTILYSVAIVLMHILKKCLFCAHLKFPLLLLLLNLIILSNEILFALMHFIWLFLIKTVFQSSH